jgi:hypothetical protein
VLTRTEELEVDVIFFGIMAAFFITVAVFQQDTAMALFVLAVAFVCLLIVYRRLSYLKWQSAAYAAVDKIYDAATVEKCRDDPLMKAGAEMALLGRRWLEKDHPR